MIFPFCHLPSCKPQGTLVIFTPAVPATHRELVFFREHHFRVLKRSEALGLIVKGMKVIAVAGTHGKTTISSMITHILSAGGIKTNAFLGGISTNLGTNFLFSPESDLVVVEADEFDRSFLKLFPDMAVLTAMDADHLDIYGDREALLETYGSFVSQIRDGGTLLMKQGLSPDHTGHLKTFTYGLSGEADFSHGRLSGKVSATGSASQPAASHPGSDPGCLRKSKS